MNCPVCLKEALFKETVEGSLTMRRCPSCEGKWLSSKDYFAWQGSLDAITPETGYSDINHDVTVTDSTQAKLCPECGRILIQFNVGHGINFCLDHCNTCNGVWFDRNEWEVLRGKNLHDEIHMIFTTSWQKEIKREERHAYFDAVYRSSFGADYDRIRDIKVWIDNHDLKPSILAFLTDQKPYE